MPDSQQPGVPDDENVPVAPVPPAPPAPVNPYVQTPAPSAPGSVNPYVTPTQVPVSQAPVVQAPGPQVPGPQTPPPPHPSQVGQASQPQPQPQPQPYAQAPQYAQAPGFPPAQVPYGYPAAPGYAGYPPAGQPAVSTFNTLGLVAIILGGVGLLFGLVPFVGLLGTVIAVVGLILGFVGIAAKSKSKGLAIAGTIVSGLAVLISAAITVVAITAITQWSPSSFESSSGDDYSWEAEAPGTLVDEDLGGTGPGSSTEPFATGETFAVLDRDGAQLWELSVGLATLDATQDVIDADELNDLAPDGYQYVTVPITYTYLGPGSESAWLDFYLYVSGNDEQLYEDAYLFEFPEHVRRADDLSTGESGTFVTAFLVKSDAVDGSLLKLENWQGATIYAALSE